ncbi:GTP 3',8-cyclase MoaA [Mycoplasmatota bacterium]|nr:GTP 3',8-cyclase MoaA [Mycoplasmatota bacterium]
MRDKYNREIDYLRISVTDRCNLRCSYCMPDGINKVTHDDILRNEEIIELVKEAVKIGIKKVRITGGEPLVRKGIYDLIKEISSVKGINEVTMTTNGVLLIGNVKKLKEAGVSRINLSLDTLKKDVFKSITGKEMFDYLELIKELKDNGMEPIKINVVLMNGINSDEINEFVELSQKYDLLIRFIELMPIGHLEFSWEDHYLKNEAILKANPNLKLFKEDLNTRYYKEDNKPGAIGLINPISKKFCSRCNRLRITSDGKIKPCLHKDDEIDIFDLSTSIYDKLKEAVESKPEEHDIDESKENEITRSMNRIGG